LTISISKDSLVKYFYYY